METEKQGLPGQHLKVQELALEKVRVWAQEQERAKPAKD